MQNLSIVYIGKKAEKRDTVANTQKVFTRLVPQLVPYEPALIMLRHPTVWINEAHLTDEMKAEINATLKADDARKAQLAEDNEDIDLDGLGVIDSANSGNDNDEPTLSDELEKLRTHAQLDAFCKENDFEFAKENQGSIPERRADIIKQAKAAQED